MGFFSASESRPLLSLFGGLFADGFWSRTLINFHVNSLAIHPSRLLNAIRPGLVRKINRHASAFAHMVITHGCEGLTLLRQLFSLVYCHSNNMQALPNLSAVSCLSVFWSV